VLAAQLDRAACSAPHGRPPWEHGQDKDLESLEQSFVAKLRATPGRYDRPLAESEMERLYALIRSVEQALGLPGADVRLARLAWERHQWQVRRWQPERPSQAGPQPVTGTALVSPPLPAAPHTEASQARQRGLQAPVQDTCPPCAADLVETEEDAALRVAHERTAAARQARSPWAAYPPTPTEPPAPRFLGGIRRRP
jgi:hypothetical protein